MDACWNNAFLLHTIQLIGDILKRWDVLKSSGHESKSYEDNSDGCGHQGSGAAPRVHRVAVVCGAPGGEWGYMGKQAKEKTHPIWSTIPLIPLTSESSWISVHWIFSMQHPRVQVIASWPSALPSNLIAKHPTASVWHAVPRFGFKFVKLKIGHLCLCLQYTQSSPALENFRTGYKRSLCQPWSPWGQAAPGWRWFGRSSSWL